MTPSVADILAQFGLAFAPGNIITLEDIQLAERCFIHPTQALIAAVGWTRVSPSFARGRLPDSRLGDLVVRRSRMDDLDAAAFAAVCGAETRPPYRHADQLFGELLCVYLQLYELTDYFHIDPVAWERRRWHRSVRPVGIVDDHVDPSALADWQRRYTAEPAYRQILIATVMWLYRMDLDGPWLASMSADWHVADAVPLLGSQGLLTHWGALVARYPGW